VLILVHVKVSMRHVSLPSVPYMLLAVRLVSQSFRNTMDWITYLTECWTSATTEVLLLLSQLESAAPIVPG
jgi:hypothetical protein